MTPASPLSNGAAPLLATAPRSNLRELSVSLVVGLFSLVTLYSTLSPRFLPFEKEIIALIAILPLLTVLLSGRIVGQARLLALWGIVQVVFLMGLLFQEDVRPVRLVSSFITLSGLLLIPFLFSSTTHLFRPARFKLLVAVAIVAALMAPAFPDAQDFGRFDPPSNLLIGLAITLLIGVGGLRRLPTRLLLFGIVLFLTFESQWRFFALAMVLISLICIGLRRPTLVLYLGGLVLLGVLLLPGLQTGSLYGVLREISPRYASIITLRGLLLELGVRYTEVQDVYAHIQAYGSPWTLLFGFGHGAEFIASSTIDMFQNVSASSWKWRFGENDTAYVVHFGPVRLFFRYGLFGVGLGLAVIWITLRETTRIFYNRSVRGMEEIIHATVCLSSLLYVMQFFLQPIEHFPLFWISFGAMLYSPLSKGMQARQNQSGPRAETAQAA